MKGKILRLISNIEYTTILYILNIIKLPDDTEPGHLQSNYLTKEITPKVYEYTVLNEK